MLSTESPQAKPTHTWGNRKKKITGNEKESFKRHRDGEKWRATNTFKVLNCLFPCHYLCIVLFPWPQKLFYAPLFLNRVCFSSTVPQLFPPRKVEHLEMWGTTRKRHPFRYDYKLNNNSLKHFTQVKDLRVTISPERWRDDVLNNRLKWADVPGIRPPFNYNL